MKFLSANEIAKKWNISDRMVRSYCAQGRIPGAFLTGKTWNIPADAVKPERESTKQFPQHVAVCAAYLSCAGPGQRRCACRYTGRLSERKRGHRR